MTDAAAPVPAQHMHSMPLLAHLEELRRRIVFSFAGVAFYRAGPMLAAFSV
jgi:hypothetical protein